MRRRVMRRSPLSTPSHMPITGSRSSCNSMANHSSGPDRTIGQSHCMHAIAPVRTPDAVVAAIKLFRAYAASLNVDLSYQDFEAEMEAMPGKLCASGGCRHVGGEDGCELPFDRLAGSGMACGGLSYLQVIRGGEWDQALSKLGPGQLPSSSAALRDNPRPTAEVFLAVWALTVVTGAQRLFRARRQLRVFSVRK